MKFKELLLTIIIAFTLSIFFRIFIAEVVMVNGDSMLDTIEHNDRVIALKQANPDRGDIVIVKLEDKAIIKRVIAVEGDTVEIKDGEVYVNDEVLKEEYIKEPMELLEYEKTELQQDEIFVMGDNRNNSLDSRTTGPIPLEDYMGQAIVSFKLWSKFEWLN